MLSKARIRLINQLKQKKYRLTNNMFIAEGSINVIDFIKSKATPVEIFATENWAEKLNNEINIDELTIVPKKELKKISSLSSPSEVVAIFNIPKQDNKNLLDSDGLVIALDNINNPGNLGTIIRTADWFGIKKIYCSKDTVDAYNPKVVQASMGSLARVTINYTDLSELFESTSANTKIFGALLKGVSIKNLKPQKKGIILIGSEAHGISKELLKYITDKITIPQIGNTSINNLESLNASVANAIICYQLT